MRVMHFKSNAPETKFCFFQNQRGEGRIVDPGLMRFDPNSHSLGLLEVKPLYDLIESLCSTLCILAHSPSE
jgi:hypothetical protein